jgi:hypothetical protein
MTHETSEAVTPAAGKAVKLGVEIASALKAKLILAYVIPPLAPTDVYGAIAPECYAYEQEAAKLIWGERLRWLRTSPASR